MNLGSINPRPRAMRSFFATFSIFSLVQTVAHAMVINITYDSSITGLGNAAQVESAINTAAQTFEALYTNNITVNVTAHFTNNISLGMSQTQETSGIPPNPLYSEVTNYLRATRTTAAASNSVASLPATDPTGGGTWWLPTAEARTFAAATGTTVYGVVANDSTQDGDVYFQSTITYTYDPTNRAVGSQFDLISVAEHEISEVLGRGYGLDYPSGNGYIPYDLFRFNSGARSFDINAASPYFSIDNGVTALKNFNPDINSGDLQDWKIYSPADSFDYAISSGQEGYLSYADLTALNVLGYSLNFQAPQLSAIRTAAGKMQLTFTNVTGLNFSILGSTNIAAPLANWTVLGMPIETSVGNYQFVDSITNKTRFYRARLN